MMADIFVSASTGAFKGINLTTNSFENFTSTAGLEPAADEIVSLCWAPSNDETEILCAQVNRQLKLYDSVSNTFTPMFKCEGGDGNIKGLDLVQKSKIVTAVESGHVNVWDLNGNSETTLDAGPDLYSLRSSPTKPNMVATGGKENPLKLWDLNNPQTPSFSAKNVRPDWLQLRVPVWVTDMQFLPQSEQIVTCTGRKQIRLYDPRTQQRRPVNQIEWMDHPFTAMSICPNPMQIVAGNSRGDMALFDLRNKGKMVQVYKGFAGSIRDIQCHSTQPLIASCGVDRFIRVHDLNTKELKHQIYCKTRLNRLLLRKNLSIFKKSSNSPTKGVKDSSEINEDEKGSDSEDELWEGMPLIGTERKKRKLETSDEPKAKKDKVKFGKKRSAEKNAAISVKKRKKMLIGVKRLQKHCADVVIKKQIRQE